MFYHRPKISPPTNFLCGKRIASSSINETLNIKNSSFGTIIQDVSVNGPILRPELVRRKVLSRRSKTPTEVQEYNILKKKQVRDLPNICPFKFRKEWLDLWGSA